jgi:hypothetical protein
VYDRNQVEKAYAQLDERRFQRIAENRKRAIAESKWRRVFGGLFLAQNFRDLRLPDMHDLGVFSRAWAPYWIHAAKVVRKYCELSSLAEVDVPAGPAYILARELFERALAGCVLSEFASELETSLIRLRPDYEGQPTGENYIGLFRFFDSLRRHLARDWPQASEPFPIATSTEETPARASTPLGHPRQSEVHHEGTLRREKTVWFLRFGGEEARLQHLTGFEYLARLLSAPHPRQPISALVLSGADRSLEAITDTQDEIIDREGERAIERRLLEIKEERAAAMEDSDSEKISSLDSEVAKIAVTLKAAQGIRGERRRFGTTVPAQKAAAAVRKCLRRAYDTIGKAQLRGLETHLRTSIKREGFAFAYRPDDPTPIWDLSTSK